VSDLVITGVYGQLGRALAEAASGRGATVRGFDLDTLDITDRVAVVGAVVDARPRAVVNCAAFTAVDRCEQEEGLATAVNGTAVGHLAEACNRVGALLVQVSTDYVFPGNGSRPYREEDPVGPLSAYGRSKLEGERAARTAERHLIARTAWLCGRGGPNFVEAIRRQVEAGRNPLRVVADQHGNPTFCDDLAAALLALVERDARGVLHVVSSSATTWFGFACEIVRQLGAGVDVVPVTTTEFPRPAPRPTYSVLDTGRLVALLGRPLPDWQDGLSRYLGVPCAS
jgi:dTDP-4-dehydrorhamnose reductase